MRWRSWAPKCSIPISFDDCSTTDQTAQSPSSSPTILPDFESGRSSLPFSIFAAAIQASIPCFTQIGTATVRMMRLRMAGRILPDRPLAVALLYISLTRIWCENETNPQLKHCLKMPSHRPHVFRKLPRRGVVQMRG